MCARPTMQGRTVCAREVQGRTAYARPTMPGPTVCARTCATTMNQSNRQTRRLQDFDYRQAGGYFITICTWNRKPILSTIRDATVQPTEIGTIVRREWERTIELRPEVALDEYVLMPDHMHAVLRIVEAVREQNASVGFHRQPRSLGSIVGGFKAASTSRIRSFLGVPGLRVWQRNYHEWIIRDDRHLEAVRRYIRQNPVRWAGAVWNCL